MNSAFCPEWSSIEVLSKYSRHGGVQILNRKPNPPNRSFSKSGLMCFSRWDYNSSEHKHANPPGQKNQSKSPPPDQCPFLWLPENPLWRPSLCRLEREMYQASQRTYSAVGIILSPLSLLSFQLVFPLLFSRAFWLLFFYPVIWTWLLILFKFNNNKKMKMTQLSMKCPRKGV